MTVHDLLADRQANARALILLVGMQASEYVEDLILELRVDADAVVADGELPILSVTADVQVNLRRRFTAELQRVAQQVLKQLGQLEQVGPDGRQLAMRDFGSRFLDAPVEVVQGLLECRAGIDRHRLPAAGAHP